MLTQPHPAAPAAHRGLSQVAADRPGQVAADHVAEHARGDDADQAGVRPATAPAASAPPNSIVTSEGTGMHADSASISKNTAR